MTLPRERTSARQPAGQRNRPAQPAGWPVFCPHERPCSIGGDRSTYHPSGRNRRSIASDGSGLMFDRRPDVDRPVELGYQAQCFPQTHIDLLEK
jgi:hypothetical protein